MTTQVLTLKKPGRCPDSIAFHDSFIAEALDNKSLIPYLKLTAREKDKHLIIRSQQEGK